MASALHQKSVENRCGLRKLDGQICGKTFASGFNLRRHIREIHRATKGTTAGKFIVFTPASISAESPVPLESFPEARPAHRQQCSPAPAFTAPKSAQIPITSLLNPSPSPTSAPHTPAASAPGPGTRMTHDDEMRAPKRIWTARGAYVEAIPSYNVPHTTLTPFRRQQRAISWLSEEAQDHFESCITTIMHSWGVTRSHTGTCIILPCAWKAADVSLLCEQLLADIDAFPNQAARRLLFEYQDHKTFFARSSSWFCGVWPRRGIDLDNFLESGPFVRQDGSHRCHNGLCVNPGHVILESCVDNQSRMECYEEAVRRRRNGQDITPTCAQHDPPCLLQHAVLTTAERVLIQIAVRKQALGEAMVAVARPRWHTMPTFETQLPVGIFRGGAVQAEPQNLCQPQQVGKPHIACAFCRPVRIFAQVTSYWEHLVHGHLEKPTSEKLGEVRRTAGVWQAWYAVSAQRCSSIHAKVSAALLDGFAWPQVVRWNLGKRRLE